MLPEQLFTACDAQKGLTMISIIQTTLLLLFITAPPDLSLVDASTLVKQNYELREIDSDSSDLEYGGYPGVYSVSGSCSYNTYFDDCSSVSGERVWKTGHSQRTSYIISGNTVTSCGRYRRESACSVCFAEKCTSTTSEQYGGTTVTYSVVPKQGQVASLSVGGADITGSCENVCTNNNGELASSTGETTCGSIGGWLVVNDDYDEACATKQTCQEIEVKEGCEGSQMGSVTGTYQPLSPSSNECSSVDQSRSIYKKKGSVDIYLFYTGSEWKFLKSFCSDIFVTGAAYFDAGDEPYLDADDRIQCYDGGNGSDKRYDYTDFSIQCKKTNGSSGSGSGSGPGSGFSQGSSDDSNMTPYDDDTYGKTSGVKRGHDANRLKFIALAVISAVYTVYTH